jgi:very-short-patch-repair endonuclease
MINFRAGAKSLHIENRLSVDILDILCHQNKAMTIVAGLPEKALKQVNLIDEIKEEDEASSEVTSLLLAEMDSWKNIDSPSTKAKATSSSTDCYLPTRLSENELFLRMLKIQSEAQTFIQEQGVNLLFIALGFLHWYEADSSDIERIAPLLLIPVNVKRASSNKDVFKLEYSNEDLVQNLSLVEKLKADFHLNLPQYQIDAQSDDDLPDLNVFFGNVKECINNQKRWSIKSDEVFLGFFSFGKFLMFNDLDSEIWPDDMQPESHPVLSRLLGDGFGDISASFSDDAHIDTLIAPGGVGFVKDADSSQTLAILEARAGRNLVIQGPPGTGKSQTITNIISDFLSQGKTVLFVAEKMAALEVVKRRLDETHLGDAVLELHSHKSTKSAIIKEIERTLQLGKPNSADSSVDFTELTQLQDQLNNYCGAVNTSIAGTGVPFIKALGHYLRLKREHDYLPEWSFDPMRTWTAENYKHHRQLVADLALHLEMTGQPSNSPFWGTELKEINPFEQDRLCRVLDLSINQLNSMVTQTIQLAEHLGFLAPVVLTDIHVICCAARRAFEAPKLKGIQLGADEWQSKGDSILKLIEAGQRMQILQEARKADFIEHAWEQDLLTERQYLNHYGEKWWRHFSGKYRKSRASLSGLCRKKLPKKNQACIAMLDDILDYQLRKRSYDQYANLGETLFAAQWNQQDSDWQTLLSISEWVIALYDDLEKGELPRGIVDFLAGHTDAVRLDEAIESIEQAAKTLQSTLHELVSKIQIEQSWPVASLLDLSLSQLEERLKIWREEIEKLEQLVRFNKSSETLVKNNLKEVAEHASNWSGAAKNLEHAFDLTWYSGLVESAYNERPELRDFVYFNHENLIDRYRRLDRLSLQHTQVQLAQSLWDKMPKINQPGEMDVLRREINKKRKHIPIRKLMIQAGRAIQGIKPVFMMSPMSIANFLAPGSLNFDLVIFDEASQIKAVDAFGAILRGKQVIVVGDTRQMPPTDFFGREIESDDIDTITGDIESILALFKARGTLERYLSWHYRSRHESLIAVSNVEFYDRKLIIFPSPGINPLATGLKFHYLPDAFYDRGRTRTNRKEAIEVANTVLEHATKHPEVSLGVVAFSMAQRDLIEIEVELLRRSRPDLDAFFTRQDVPEPFFIKNLENVQGDERDVILISIGYGRNESGKIAKEFGPLNRQGGERRLNVLITRAKLGMEVFSNFRGDELELDAQSSHGVRALKHFLTYAETGKLDIPKETGKEPDSPFEYEVIFALQNRHYQVEPQVGTAGYFIDIAVKDPDYPGRYVLAIECDGATYHSARSARDRDRLRQGVLEGLGWRFHRIWSTDWFKNPGKETDRAIAAIEEARRSVTILDQTIEALIPEESPVKLVRDEPETEKQTIQSEPYKKAQLSSSHLSMQQIYDVDSKLLAGLIKEIVIIETPAHEFDIARRLLDFFGLKRAGNQVSAKINDAITVGHRIGLFDYHGGFLYADKNRTSTVRSRREFDTNDRKLERVSPEEIDVALLEAIHLGFSMSSKNAIASSLDLLGFGRVTENMNAIVSVRIGKLLETKQLVVENEILRKA